MKHIKVIMCAVFLLSVGLASLHAQESINAAGGDAAGNGGSVSYSVGQITYQTNAGPDGSEAQGVQQPYEISVVTNSEQFKNITLSVTAYPNPTSGFLTLQIDESDISNFSFRLYDVNGKLLLNNEVTNNHTSIAMQDYVAAGYYLKVFRKSTEIKSFKVIKTN